MEFPKLFALAFAWSFLVAVQTRLVADGKRPFALAAWAFMTSLTWVFVVRHVAVSQDVESAIAYALGSAIGWSASLCLRRGGKRE